MPNPSFSGRNRRVPFFAINCWIILLGLATTNCASTTTRTYEGGASNRAAARSGSSVTVRQSDPDEDCREVGPIEATDGQGCGLFGARGTYDGAYSELKRLAAIRGADFVRIDEQVEPHQLHDACYNNEFTIRGVAFRCRERKPREPIELPSTQCLTSEQVAERAADLDTRREIGRISTERYERERAALAERKCEESEIPDAAPTAGPAQGATEDASDEVEADSPESPPVGRTEERLRELEQLREKGLITDEEYEAKREEILDEL